MEFPTLGEHCQSPNCNQIDFLPLECKCTKLFCRDHFNDHCISGECELAPKPKEARLLNDSQIFKCSEKGCRKGDYIEMCCEKCNKHYCVDHRFHPSCPELDEAERAALSEKFAAPKRLFAERNKVLQEKITENIRKALQSSDKIKTATKISIMRMKMGAVGLKSIPPLKRVYFGIKPPQNNEPKSVKIVNNEDGISNCNISVYLDPSYKDTMSVFLNKEWSLGKALDSICDSCHITNNNNKINNVKLRLFRLLDSYCISPVKMDVELSELLDKQILVQGDKLVVEYIDTNVLKDLEDDNVHLFLDNQVLEK